MTFTMIFNPAGVLVKLLRNDVLRHIKRVKSMSIIIIFLFVLLLYCVSVRIPKSEKYLLMYKVYAFCLFYMFSLLIVHTFEMRWKITLGNTK